MSHPTVPLLRLCIEQMAGRIAAARMHRIIAQSSAERARYDRAYTRRRAALMRLTDALIRASKES
jgi:hypothetical protein